VCPKAHRMKFLKNPIRGNCSLCKGCDDNLQFECGESGCYREKYCNICIPLVSIRDKEIRAKKEEEVPIDYPMMKCDEGHEWTLVNLGNTYREYKKCFKCQGFAQVKLKNNDWLIWKCGDCDKWGCTDCLGMPYAEIIPCKKKHKMQVEKFPVRGWCMLCNQCDENIRWKCEHCYRDLVCTNCVPFKSIKEKN